MLATVALLFLLGDSAKRSSDAAAPPARPPVEHIVDPPRPDNQSRVAVIVPADYVVGGGW